MVFFRLFYDDDYTFDFWLKKTGVYSPVFCSSHLGIKYGANVFLIICSACTGFILSSQAHRRVLVNVPNRLSATAVPSPAPATAAISPIPACLAIAPHIVKAIILHNIPT
jgi:UPF0716 family protein affecting phage T7 exclusion